MLVVDLLSFLFVISIDCGILTYSLLVPAASMLDHFTVFTRGGIVLWSSSFSQLQGDPVNDLVREVLVEERTGQRAFESGSYTVHWTLANELNIVFVVRSMY
jgi:hypothetical protein